MKYNKILVVFFYLFLFLFGFYLGKKEVHLNEEAIRGEEAYRVTMMILRDLNRVRRLK